MQYIIILKAVKIFLTSERKCILVCWLLMAWFQNCYTVLHKCTVRQCTIGNKSTVRTFLISIDTSPRISQLSFRFLANFCFHYTVVNFLNFFWQYSTFFYWNLPTMFRTVASFIYFPLKTSSAHLPLILDNCREKLCYFLDIEK